jgi:uncharacterized protein YyaL (SSP411 family)
MPFMLSNIARWHGQPAQVVIAGTPGSADTLALEAVAASVYLPWAVQIPIQPGAATTLLAPDLPWLSAMAAKAGPATGYVCQDFVCQAPATDPAAFERQLREAAEPRRIV